jgi:hypothetical protein
VARERSARRLARRVHERPARRGARVAGGVGVPGDPPADGGAVAGRGLTEGGRHGAGGVRVAEQLPEHQHARRNGAAGAVAGDGAAPKGLVARGGQAEGLGQRHASAAMGHADTLVEQGGALLGRRDDGGAIAHGPPGPTAPSTQ